MAIVPAPAVTINGLGTYQIPYPGGGTQPQGAPGQWTQVKLENASPYGLTIALGGTPVYSLPACVADVLPLTLGPSGPGLPATASLTTPAPQITAVANLSADTGQNSSGTLRPSFGQFGDSFPGVYPVALPAMPYSERSFASLPGTSVLLSGNLGPVTLIPAPPAGFVYNVGPMISFSNVTSQATATILGITSGVIYFIVTLTPTTESVFPFGIAALNEGLQWTLNVSPGPVRAATVYTPVALA